MADDEICRAFRNTGNCRYGENCKFLHEEGPPIAPPNKPVGMCFAFEADGECQFGDRCRFRHGESDTRFDADGCRDVSQEICRDFRAGRCRLGPECPRQHVDAPEGGEPDGEGHRKTEGGKKRRGQREVKKVDEVCENYLAGRCRYGDQCRRQHVGEIEQHVEKIDEVCNNFLEGRCRFGDMCRRQHPAQ